MSRSLHQWRKSESAAADPPRAEPSGPSTSTAVARFGVTSRAIQVALGCLWIFDAALQYQPAMFGHGLVNQMMLPNASGQPAPVAWSITSMGHFLAHNVGAWNFLFATGQLVIGLGLLFRRTVRPALVLMFAWCFGVWWFGEGFGQLLTGNAIPLSGAPGAVTLYAAIGVLVWPRRQPASSEAPTQNNKHTDASGRFGATSAAAKGPLGTAGALAIWSGFWILSAVIWLMPANRSADSVHHAISGMASGQPGWYSHFLTAVAGHFSGLGAQTAWALAVASLIIGLGPLLTSRPTPFLAAGAALQVAFWVTGMGLGGILTGMGTDPNIAPLVVLLAVSMLPIVAPTRYAAPAPLAALVRSRPTVAGGTAAVTFVAILLSATYPLAGSASSASPSSSGNMSGMAGMPGMGGSATPSSGKSSTAGGGMTGMGGLGVQDPSWSYTGPALPTQEVSLLSTVSTTTDQGHLMQMASCSAKPSATQMLGALQYVQQTSAAVAQYKTLSAATAAGYIPITDTAYPVVHYVKPSNMRPGFVMDPNHVQSLVYAFTPYGSVLVAAMYLMPRAGEQGPMPYGCLAQWHAHTNLCMSATAREFVGFTPCAPDTFNVPTPVMTHVWQVPVAGGPLAMDPSDLQIVEAAVQAQLSGQAPMQYPQGNAPPQPGPPGVGF